jgi:hypothetical protein
MSETKLSIEDEIIYNDLEKKFNQNIITKDEFDSQKEEIFKRYTKVQEIELNENISDFEIIQIKKSAKDYVNENEAIVSNEELLLEKQTTIKKRIQKFEKMKGIGYFFNITISNWLFLLFFFIFEVLFFIFYGLFSTYGDINLDSNLGKKNNADYLYKNFQDMTVKLYFISGNFVFRFWITFYFYG